MKNLIVLVPLALATLLGSVTAESIKREAVPVMQRRSHAKRLESVKRAPAAGMTYQGCYPDNTAGRLLKYTAYQGNANNSVEACTAACDTAGYTIAGLEWSQECFCGIAFATQVTKVANDTAECNMKCTGNNAQMCGGSSRLSIYSATVPSTNVVSAAKATVDTFNNLGCYTEATSGRALTGSAKSDPQMSVEMCSSLCSGFAYMGVEYGSECYCGNSLNAGSALGVSTTCNMPCAGDKTELCGGPNRLTLYKNSAVTTTSVNPTIGVANFQGCYIEPVPARALTYRAYSAANNTVQGCQSTCSAAGYAVAGLEYGSECWCGKSFTQGTVSTSLSDCSMQCSGNSLQTCGGPNRLSVYSATVPGFTSTAALVPINAPNTQFLFGGCIADSVSARVFPTVGQGGTLESCAASCTNYPYFGVEYGNECYCGLTIPSNVGVFSGLGAALSSKCNTACSGNPSQICGGANALSVYYSADISFFQSTPLTGTSLLGCYADSNNARSLGLNKTVLANTLTPLACSSYCRLGGYKYSGLEWSTECWCGNTLDNLAANGKVDTSQCNMPCSGDSNTMCGGNSRISIYQDSTYVQKVFTVSKFQTFQNVGCYTDDPGNRSLPNRINTPFNTATPYTCLAACKTAGYKYCGLEWSGECYGSNVAPTSSIAPSASGSTTDQTSQGCNMACNGASGLWCGGSNRITVYQDGFTNVANPVLV